MPIDNCAIGTNVNFVNKELVNIYGCKIGDNVKIGPFVEFVKVFTLWRMYLLDME